MKSLSRVNAERYLAITVLLLSALLFQPQTLTRTEAVQRDQAVVKKFVFGDVAIETVMRGSGETIRAAPGPRL